MKKFIFLLIILFCPLVFAQEVDVTSNCYGSTGYSGMYSGDEVQYQTYSTYNFGTLYQYQLSSFETELRYQLLADTIYTVTINTNGGNDFRNNFRTWSVYDLNNNNNDLVTGFTFISMKKIQITFQTTTATNNVKIQFGGANSYDNITGNTNWNIKNVILTVPDNAPTGSTTQDVIDNQTNNTNSIINNNNQNTTDIIDNANQNTQSIIDNQNSNQDQTNQLLGQCYKNLYNYARVNSLTNLNYSDGSYVQYQADTAIISRLKLQFFSTLSYQGLVGVSDYNPIVSVGRFKWTFQKNSTFSYISFGVNGAETDSLVDGYSVNNLENGKTYSLIYDISNATQGSITISNVMIIEGSTLIPYVEYNKSYCESKIDGVSGAISDIGQQAAQNAQDIINNQNSNSQATQDVIKDTLTDCQNAGPISFTTISGYELQANGSIVTSPSWLVTDYINVYPGLRYNFTGFSSRYVCYYNKNKVATRCGPLSTNPIIIPSDVYYLRLNSLISSYNGVFTALSDYCSNKIDVTNDAINNVNDTLNNSNVDSNVGTGFFDDFDDEDFGLSDIITIPLTTIQSLTSKTCSPLSIPIPFTNSNISLPCMTEIYNKFPTIFNLWHIVSFGIISYFIAIDIFHLVKGFKDPESDKVEVLDL